MMRSEYTPLYGNYIPLPKWTRQPHPMDLPECIEWHPTRERNTVSVMWYPKRERGLADSEKNNTDRLNSWPLRLQFCKQFASQVHGGTSSNTKFLQAKKVFREARPGDNSVSKCNFCFFFLYSVARLLGLVFFAIVRTPLPFSSPLVFLRRIWCVMAYYGGTYQKPYPQRLTRLLTREVGEGHVNYAYRLRNPLCEREGNNPLKNEQCPKNPNCFLSLGEEERGKQKEEELLLKRLGLNPNTILKSETDQFVGLKVTNRQNVWRC